MNDTIKDSGKQMPTENAGQMRKKNEPERGNRINNGKTGRHNKKGETGPRRTSR